MRSVFLSLACLATLAAAPKVTVHVDDDAAPGGNGSRRAPFRTVEAAVALANSLGERTTIKVAPGTYEVATSLVLTAPVALRGSTEWLIAGGGPTGQALAGTETRIIGAASLGGSPMLVVGAPGRVLDGVAISGVIFETSAAIGGLLEIRRVQNLTVHDNLFIGTGSAAGSTPGLSTFASSGAIHDVYMTGLLGGAFLAAGYTDSPAVISFHDNRSVRNQNGLLLTGTSDGIPEPGDHLDVDVHDNDLSDNALNAAFSAGIRILLKGNEGLPGGTAGLSAGRVTGRIHDNRVADNTTGIVIDAGFPYRRIPGTSSCDTRTFSGRVELSFHDNSLVGNTWPPLITLTRFQAVGNATLGARFQFLHDAAYVIDDPGNLFAAARIDNPANDPYVGGPCAADVQSEALNNVLFVNGLQR